MPFPGNGCLTGRLPNYPARILNPLLAHRPQPVSRPSRRGGRIRVQGVALVGGRRIETAGPFRFLFGHEKEGHTSKTPFARQPGTKKKGHPATCRSPRSNQPKEQTAGGRAPRCPLPSLSTIPAKFVETCPLLRFSTNSCLLYLYIPDIRIVL